MGSLISLTTNTNECDDQKLEEQKQIKSKRYNYLLDSIELMRLKKILHQYMESMNGISKLKSIMHQIDINVVMNDFLYLLTHYNSDDEFELICDSLDHCNLETCLSFRRNHRIRIRSNSNKLNMLKEPANIIATQQILDKIHCFYVHSFDTRYRFRLNSNINEQKTSDNQSTDVTEQISFDADYLSQIKHFLVHKYNQLYYQQQDNSTFIANIFNNYNLGKQFEYGYDEEQTYEYGSIKIYTVKPKYLSLKKELLQQQIAPINIEQYDSEVLKAQVHFDSFYRKNEYPDLSIQHILALLFYCNYDKLQCEFSKTYRINCNTDHSNFYHFGKLLKMTVHQHGHHSADNKVSKFYHGIGEKLLIPPIIGIIGNGGLQIYCPLSTSTSFAVAANFTNFNQGVIVEFSHGLMGFSKYFQCFWLSDYPGEAEHLFIQNCTGCLTVSNIIDAETHIEYDSIIQSLNIIQDILSSTQFVINIADDQHENRFHIDKFNVREIIDKIMSNQLSSKFSDYEPFSSLDKFGQFMCINYFQHKTSVVINFERLIQDEYKFLLRFMMDIKQQQLSFAYIQTLFPNMENLSVNYINFNSIGFKVLQSVLTIPTSKLKYLHLKPCPECKLDAATVVSQYNEMFDAMGFDIKLGINKTEIVIQTHSDLPEDFFLRY